MNMKQTGTCKISCVVCERMKTWIENSCTNGALTSLNVASMYQRFAIFNSFSWTGVEKMRWHSAPTLTLPKIEVFVYVMMVDLKIVRFRVSGTHWSTVVVDNTGKMIQWGTAFIFPFICWPLATSSATWRPPVVSLILPTDFASLIISSFAAMLMSGLHACWGRVMEK